MPTFEISFSDLEKLLGRPLPQGNQLAELLSYAKAEIENEEGDKATINVEDSNRPDLLCVEGLARQLKGALEVETGLKNYQIHNSEYKVIVNGKLESIRGFIACAVVTGVKLSGDLIKQLMQMQEKLDATHGRGRKKTSIGLYNSDTLKWPLKYTLTKPHENAFVPLGFADAMAPHEILKNHPKGPEYGHILKNLEEYPIFMDSVNKVLSMPPIVNSNDLGQINEHSENILIEVTGTDYNTVNNILRLFAMSLADRGGKIFNVKVDYPYRKTDTTPNFDTKRMTLHPQKVNDILGLKLDAVDMVKILKMMRFGASQNLDAVSNNVLADVPAYRTDVMHAVDIYEDIAIGYGFHKFTAEPIALATTGSLSSAEKVSRKFREACIGLGAQEIMSFDLTNKDSLFKLMGAKEEKVVEVDNPITFTFSCLRNKLLPSIMEFLSKNTKKEYPQRIFEVGDVVYPDSKADEMSVTEQRLAFAISHSDVTFTEAKQCLDAVFSNLGIKIAVREEEHESFIAGRCAAIYSGKERIGIIGEVHPQVLANWGLEMPVVGFEVKL